MTMMQTAATTLPYNCAVGANLPFGGSEILAISLGFVFVAITFTITFMDVAVKQMWVQMRDPAAQARIEALQAQFPSLGGAKKADAEADDEDDEHAALTKKAAPAAVKGGALPAYDRIVSQSPYVAGRSVDEDLIVVLANKNAFGTVSEYCSSTVRGYAMLSTTLLVAGFALSYMWIHNAMVDPRNNDFWGKLALVGYCLVFCTGVVMCKPSSYAVDRDANICLWSNVPYKIFGKYSNPTLDLHGLGIGSFVLLPLVCHTVRLFTWGQAGMPNYAWTVSGIAWTLIGAILFGAPGWLAGKIPQWPWFDGVMAKKCAIIGEIVAVFASFLACAQYEFYATAACANYATQYQALLVGAAAAPFVFVTRHYCCAPSSFVTAPSVMLMNGSTPVATSGPVTALQFDEQHAVIPHE